MLLERMTPSVNFPASLRAESISAFCAGESSRNRAIFSTSSGGIDRQIHHRSEEHTSELQSLMRISYAVFCLKKKTTPPPLLIPTYRSNHSQPTNQHHIPISLLLYRA